VRFLERACTLLTRMVTVRREIGGYNPCFTPQFHCASHLFVISLTITKLEAEVIVRA